MTVVVDENYKISIRAGYASFTISAESSEDYPELPDVNEGRPVHIPQNALKDLIREGLSGKLSQMPVDAQEKVQSALTKMLNEGDGGMICILL